MNMEPHPKDSFSSVMRYTLGRPGESSLDLYAQSPNIGITRTFEGGRMAGNDTKEFRIPERWVIRGGCCLALCQDSLVRPALPEYGLERIVGFCIRTIENNRVAVRVAGSILLKVEGLGLNDAGKTVFVIGPNTFTFNSQVGGMPLGTVKHIEAAGAMVSFGARQKVAKECYAGAVGRHY